MPWKIQQQQKIMALKGFSITTCPHHSQILATLVALLFTPVPNKSVGRDSFKLAQL